MEFPNRLPKTQSTEIDHIRDTLTSVVNVVGETRQDIKKLDQKIEARFDQQDKRFDQQGSDILEVKAEVRALNTRFAQQDKEIAAVRADNAEIKEMLKALLSR